LTPAEFTEQNFSMHSNRCFMELELLEAPQAIRAALERYTAAPPNYGFSVPLCEQLERCTTLYWIGCGSSYHAAKAMAPWWQSWTGQHVEVCPASAFARPPFLPSGLSRDAAMLAISQSGNSSDVVAAWRRAQPYADYTIALVNQAHSTLGQNCNHTLDMLAGRELSVPATKSYLNSVLTLTLLAHAVAKGRGRSIAEHDFSTQLIHNIPQQLEQLSCLRNRCRQMIQHIHEHTRHTKASVCILGNGSLFVAAQELALKLQECTYLPAQAFPLLEFLHGPIAMLDEQAIVWLLLDETGYHDLEMQQSIQRIQQTGAWIMGWSHFNKPLQWYTPQETLLLPHTNAGWLNHILLVYLGYWLAYEWGTHLGHPIDHPRHLSKQVIYPTQTESRNSSAPTNGRFS
jgi:glucosamine--fructose-6-phosphate aminotransferase (isomerizing)